MYPLPNFSLTGCPECFPSLYKSVMEGVSEGKESSLIEVKISQVSTIYKDTGRVNALLGLYAESWSQTSWHRGSLTSAIIHLCQHQVCRNEAETLPVETVVSNCARDACGRDGSMCGSLCTGTALSSASGPRTEKAGPAFNFPPPSLPYRICRPSIF